MFGVAIDLKDRTALSLFAGGSTRLSQPPTPEESPVASDTL
jgi:hypothetical protein